MNNFSEKANFLWSIADLIRDVVKRGKYQDVILPFTVLRRLDSVLAPTKQDVFETYNRYKDRLENLDPQLRKASDAALGERDDSAAVCVNTKGRPEPDSDLRDYENVPLSESVWEYFEREVLPHVPDAWIDESYTDDKDSGIGKVGYEINFNRYFYVCEPPRPLDEIEADIRTLEREIMVMLREVTE